MTKVYSLHQLGGSLAIQLMDDLGIQWDSNTAQVTALDHCTVALEAFLF